MRTARNAILTISVTLTALLITATAAQAKGAETAGKNLGEMLSAIGGYVLLAIAGLIAIGMMVSRQASKIGALLIMVFVIGGLFFAPGELNDLIRSTWRALGRGV